MRILGDLDLVPTNRTTDAMRPWWQTDLAKSRDTESRPTVIISLCCTNINPERAWTSMGS
jgi:hypothetical protein